MKWLMRILGKGKKKTAGFTLIELMVVVIVVGILAAAAIPLYRFAMARAYASEAKATCGTIKTALIVLATEEAGGELPVIPTDYSPGSNHTWLLPLGVDTATNTWWHDEGRGADTCMFGCGDASATIDATQISAADGITDTGQLYVWVYSLEDADKIEGISMAMNITTGDWYENWSYTY